MSRVVVRYRVRPECVEENERLIRAVFEELDQVRPQGFTYESTVLSDGATFVHVVDGDSAELVTLPSFQRFASTVGGRCEDPPVQSSVRIVGSYAGHDAGGSS